MIDKTIGIIGFGTMGKAVVEGILSKGIVSEKNIIASAKSLSQSACSIRYTTSNRDVVKVSDVVILAVKPQMMKAVLEEIKDTVTNNTLIVSIAAGLSIHYFQKAFGERQPIVRSMPNLCAQKSESMTAWYCSAVVTEQQKEIIKEIFNAIGKEVELQNESMFNSFTAIGGSGPSYVFALAEFMLQAAIDFGFSKEEAKKIVYQTLTGAVQILVSSHFSPHELRTKVTSKGGVTEAAFSEFAKGKLGEIFLAGIQANKQRGEELTMEGEKV